MNYDLNICNRLKKFYEDVADAWEGWKEKPESPNIRIGTLGEPTGHPEFFDILEKTKPKVIMTDGRILGTTGDPRRVELIDKLLEYESGVSLLWSDTRYCKKACQNLKSSGINFEIGIRINTPESLEEILKDIWKESEKYILIPKEGITISSDDLKDKENTKIIEYYQNILLTDKKIIITKDSTNLKPIKVYDRI